ncbi:MAG: undecaprenyl-diphosphate phosphatase [Candidatus Bathyarchaeota archaeon]|nr:undecaprenyl-diphosphate phosphatase [Candidatus Bathyarchaeota archaeon]
MEPLVASLIVGLLQGLLEWLPISSQGNLVVLMMSVLGLEPDFALSLSVYLHLGTGLAALVYFREEVLDAIRRDSDSDRALFRFLVIATFTTGVVGLPIFLVVRGASMYGEALLALTGAALIVTGLVQKGAQTEGARTTESLESREGVILGLVQGLSAIPGLSRSGLTTSALLIRKYSGEESFRISFLMSVPAVFAAAVGLVYLEGVPALESGLLASLTSSFISAYLSIDILLRVARRIRFWGLCVLLGTLAILPQVVYLF